MKAQASASRQVLDQHRSSQPGNDLMMRDPFVPAAQRLPGCVLDDGPFVIFPGESADGVQAGEERDGVNMTS